MKLYVYSFLFFLLLVTHGQAEGQNTKGMPMDDIAQQVKKAGISRETYEVYKKMVERYQYYRVDEAVTYAKMVLYIAYELNDSLLISQAYTTIGDLLMGVEAGKSALKYYERSLKIQRNLQNIIGLAQALYDKAVIEQTLKQFDKAELQYLEALEILKNTSGTDSLTIGQISFNTLNKLMELNLDRNDLIQAKEYLVMADMLSNKIDPAPKHFLKFLINKAVYFNLLSQDQLAQQLKDSILVMAKRYENPLFQLTLFEGLARFYDHPEQPEEKISYLKKALQLSRQINRTTQGFNFASQISAIYNSLLVPDSAFYYLKLAYQLKADNPLAGFEVDLMLYEFEIDLNELQAKEQIEIKNRNLIFIFLLLVLTAVILLLVMRIRLIRNKRKILEELATHNYLEAQKVLLEKKNIEQELEHNNKSFVTALIYQIRKQELIKEAFFELSQHRNVFGTKLFRELSLIISKIGIANNDQLTDDFLLAFEKIHPRLFEKLFMINPDITKNDRVLIAYLYLGLSTKEIASISRKTLRSIEVARTRLRKKLNITDPNLQFVDFFSTM